MKKMLIVLLIVLPTQAFADFVANFGLHGGKIESENTVMDKPVVKSPIYGFNGEIEFGWPYLTFFGRFDFSQGNGKSQYNFTDPDDALNTATVEDLKTTIRFSKLSGGIRVKLLKMKYFRLYVGGGLHAGFLSLSYDKDDFKQEQGNTIGFEEDERKNIRGGFAEAGMEIIVDHNSGIRLSAQRTSMSSDQFDTLNREKLKFNYTTFSLNYIEYIETSKW